MKINDGRIDKSLYAAISDEFQKTMDAWSEKFAEIESVRRKNNLELLYLSTVNLIDIVKNTQNYFEKNVYHSMSRLQFAQCYGTVKVCTSRESGHTTVISRLIEEKFNKVIVVLPTMNMVEIYKRLPSFQNIKNKIYFCSPNCFESKLLGFYDFEAVIVDCSFLISQSKIDELYKITCSVMDRRPLYLFME